MGACTEQQQLDLWRCACVSAKQNQAPARDRGLQSVEHHRGIAALLARESNRVAQLDLTTCAKGSRKKTITGMAALTHRDREAWHLA